MKLYPIAEIVYSLQGDGVHVGIPAVFIRFARCRAVRDRLTANEVAKLARICNFRCAWAVLTGAEPALHVDAELIDALHDVGFRIAVETNGALALEQIAFDWITVVPEPGTQVRVRNADEIKYAIRHGDPIPLPPVPARYYVLSPAFEGDRLDPKDLEWCIQLVKDNPQWRLSVRQDAVCKIR